MLEKKLSDIGLLVEIQYLPCIEWIKKAMLLKHVKIEACENFQKMSFRNRCAISGSNGVIFLSIPLRKGREQNTPITNIEMLPDLTWRTQHWKTILSCYSRAPFFEYYATTINELLFQETNNLFHFNLTIISGIFKMLNTDVEISFTSQFDKTNNNSGIEDLRNKWLPKNSRPQQPGWQPRYQQVFEEKTRFNQNLSILDLLLCEGPHARWLLEESA